MHKLAYAGLLLFASTAPAVTILDVSAPQNGIGGALRSSLVQAQGWSISTAYSNVSISVHLFAFGTDDTPNLQAYLMDQIGPGTTAANEIASVTLAPSVDGIASPYLTGSTAVALFSGLSLSAGTYYLVLHSPDSPTSNTNWNYGAPISSMNVVTDAGAALLGSRSFVGAVDPYPAASGFSPAGNSSYWMTIVGDAVGQTVPEPSTGAICLAGLLLVRFLARSGRSG